jgi:hypothetical protein
LNQRRQRQLCSLWHQFLPYFRCWKCVNISSLTIYIFLCDGGWRPQAEPLDKPPFERLMPGKQPLDMNKVKLQPKAFSHEISRTHKGHQLLGGRSLKPRSNAGNLWVALKFSATANTTNRCPFMKSLYGSNQSRIHPIPPFSGKTRI